MTDKEAIEEAETVIRHFIKEFDRSQAFPKMHGLNKTYASANDWLEKYSVPKYMSVMRRIRTTDIDLFDYLIDNRFGLSAFIFCGDPPTIKNVCTALMQYAEAHSLSFDSRAINRDDHIFILEKKGTILLSVNSHTYIDVPCFSVGYIHE